MTTTAPTTPKPRRRWLRFSLRTLLTLMLVLGAGFGWLGREIQRARAQRRAVAVIEITGGRVDYSHVSGVRGAVAWLGKLFGEDLPADVTGVMFLRTCFSEAGLTHLRGLAQLQTLSLNNTQVTDAGLGHLEELTQLKALYLGRTKVTDAGVAELQKALPNCNIRR